MVSHTPMAAGPPPHTHIDAKPISLPCCRSRQVEVSTVDSWDDMELADQPEWMGSGFGEFESFIYNFLIGGGALLWGGASRVGHDWGAEGGPRDGGKVAGPEKGGAMGGRPPGGAMIEGGEII